MTTKLPFETEDFHAVLADATRRQVVSRLLDEDPVSVDALAEHVAASERPTPNGSAGNRTDVHLTLRHNHLPRLADRGLINYDIENGIVALTDSNDRLRSFVTAIEAIDAYHSVRE